MTESVVCLKKWLRVYSGVQKSHETQKRDLSKETIKREWECIVEYRSAAEP